MSVIEYRTHDKSAWGDGPWQDEPDKIQYVDEETGLSCLIKRNHYGALCGYVGVPNNHPYYGVSYQDVDADVHGGLTYSDKCQDGDEAHSICHIPAPGEPDDVWWLGFDCGHASDLSPALQSQMNQFGIEWPPSSSRETYKPVGYVREENAFLARQLKKAEDGE